MKSTKSKKIILFASAVAVLLITSAIIVGTFIKIQNKIRRQMFYNYMEQIDELSSQIMNTIRLEIEYSAYLLKSVEETLDINIDSLDESINSLKNLKNKGNFKTLGIIDYKGNYFDTENNYYKINMQNFLKNINFGEKNYSYYVSDVLNEKNKKEIAIAVPIYKENKMTGVLFGYYPLIEITEEVNINEKDYQFFQLIDTKGNFISHSTSSKSFTK